MLETSHEMENGEKRNVREREREISEYQKFKKRNLKIGNRNLKSEYLPRNQKPKSRKSHNEKLKTKSEKRIIKKIKINKSKNKK